MLSAGSFAEQWVTTNDVVHIHSNELSEGIADKRSCLEWPSILPRFFLRASRGSTILHHGRPPLHNYRAAAGLPTLPNGEISRRSSSFFFFFVAVVHCCITRLPRDSVRRPVRRKRAPPTEMRSSLGRSLATARQRQVKNGDTRWHK